MGVHHRVPADLPLPVVVTMSHCARLKLRGGPFDGQEVAFLPPDLTPPVQIVWSGWFPWGFSAYLYEWHGETVADQGRTDALIYRPPIGQDDHMRVYRGRRLAADEIPPLIAADTEIWADGAALIAAAFDVPPEVMWSGV